MSRCLGTQFQKDFLFAVAELVQSVQKRVGLYGPGNDSVYGRSLAGIVGLNPIRNMDVCVVCVVQ